MNKVIHCQVGIYDTQYELTTHKDGSVTVRAPNIKWRGNAGNLTYANRRVIRPSLVAQIKRFFGEGILVDETGETLDNLIY